MQDHRSPRATTAAPRATAAGSAATGSATPRTAAGRTAATHAGRTAETATAKAPCGSLQGTRFRRVGIKALGLDLLVHVLLHIDSCVVAQGTRCGSGHVEPGEQPFMHLLRGHAPGTASSLRAVRSSLGIGLSTRLTPVCSGLAPGSGVTGLSTTCSSATCSSAACSSAACLAAAPGPTAAASVAPSPTAATSVAPSPTTAAAIGASPATAAAIGTASLAVGLPASRPGLAVGHLLLDIFSHVLRFLLGRHLGEFPQLRQLLRFVRLARCPLLGWGHLLKVVPHFLKQFAPFVRRKPL